MRFPSILLIFFLLIISCNGERPQLEPATNSPDNMLKLKGSETMKPLMTSLLSFFSEKTMQPLIDYDATGSNAAILSFERDEADLIALSRALTDEEMEHLKKNGELEIVKIAYDGLDIIVNRSNKIDKLTLTQLRDIYTGKTKNWSEIGGEYLPIRAYSRDANSGTYDFFQNHVLNSLNYRSDDVNCVSNEDIISGVKGDIQGIGYTGTTFNLTDVKQLELSADEGKTWFDNRKQNIRNQVYPITRPLYLVYYSKNKTKISDLLAFILSAEGQQHIEEIGFIAAYGNEYE